MPTRVTLPLPVGPAPGTVPGPVRRGPWWWPVAWLLAASALLGAGLPTAVRAAPLPTMLFRHLDQQGGLSHNTVLHSLQDSRGFVWLATNNGLNRYDGTTVRQYLRAPGTPGALPSAFVWRLAEDRHGDLWLATQGAGLVRWRRAEDRFETIALTAPAGSADAALAAARSKARAVHVAPDGRVWVGTRGGAVVLDEAGRLVRSYRHAANDAGSLASDVVTAIASGPDGSVWIGTDKGLDRLRPGADGFEHHRADPADPARLADDAVLALLFDRRGALWVGTFAGGLHRLRPDGRFERYQARTGDDDALAGNQVAALLEDAQRRLWVATDQGLSLLDRGTGRFRHARHDPADPSSLAKGMLLSLMQDRAGLLWVGSLDSGIGRWDPRGWSFDLLRSTAFADASISALAPTADGRGLWVGTYGRGLLRFDMAPGGGWQAPRAFGPELGLPALSGAQVISLLVTRAGELWAGTHSHGLNRWDPRRRRLTVYRHDAADPASLGADGVLALVEADDGAVWAGTQGGGTARIDPATGAVRRYPLVLGDARTRVNALVEAGKGRFWIGTSDGSLERLDVATGRTESFGRVAGGLGAGATEADTINALHRDADDTLWVGTASGGLLRLPQAGLAVAPGRFQRLTTADGLVSNVIHGVRPGSDGGLWLSSNQGLMRLDPVTLAVRAFHRSHGLQGEDFNLNVHAAGPDGRLYFGGPGGINAFDPRQVATNGVPPLVALTGFEKFNRPVPVGEPAELPLAYDDDMVSLTFAALDFAEPERNRYSFRLEGYDRAWSEPGPIDRATYTDLPAGRYTLKVRAANSDGVWAERAFELKLRVAPAPWLTWWALTAYGLATLLIVWLLLRWRLQRMEYHARYRQLAYYDQVTGLPNLQLFEQRAAAALQRAAARSETLAMLCVHVGGLRGASRSLGHAAVDEVLRSFATRLNRLVHGGSESVEQCDVARLAGESFIAYFQTADAAADAEAVVARLLSERGVGSGPATAEGQGSATRSAIGISMYPMHGASVDELIAHADTAAAQAAIERRRGVVRYEQAMTARARDRLALEADLRAAIAEKTLELHFQPKYDAQIRVVGAEALLRWQHPVRGWVSPAVFIPLAEESRLVEALDDFVVNRACETLKGFMDRGERTLPIAINISAEDLSGGRIVGVLAAAVVAHGVPASLLEVEITESALLREVDKAAAALAQIKAAGHKLVLDDFGTGYSSLTHLQHFPIDCVKIDRSFVVAGERGDGASVCRGIVALAKSLRLKTVAEGVETEAQRDTMLQLGCDELQGWLFSKAMPGADYAKLVGPAVAVEPRAASAEPANGPVVEHSPQVA